MKNSINFLLAALMLLASTLTFNANAITTEDNLTTEKSQLIVKVAPSEKGKAFNLMLSNLNNERTTIKVVDVIGYAIHSESLIKEIGYSKTINLDNMPIGDYMLHVQHPAGNFTHAFHLGEVVSFFETKQQQNGFTQLVNQKDSPKTSPVFTVEENSLDVQVNKMEGQKTRVHVCNVNGKIFFSKKIKTPADAEQSFKTKRLSDGIYMMIVRSGKTTTIQPFEKMEEGIELKNTLVSKPLTLGSMEVYTLR